MNTKKREEQKTPPAVKKTTRHDFFRATSVAITSAQLRHKHVETRTEKKNEIY